MPATHTASLRIAAAAEREIVITRDFDAPRALVFDAFTKPELIRRWLLGAPGWEMVVCDIDLRVGGSYRWVWRRAKAAAEGSECGEMVEMGMGGVYREIVPPERLVSTEKFDQSWYPGEAVGTIVLVERDGKTTLTQTMLYESREARDAVLASPMEEGVAASYDWLEELLAAQTAG
jgi:uncharacterized protein YndB with AHSA1/START domain